MCFLTNSFLLLIGSTSWHAYHKQWLRGDPDAQDVISLAVEILTRIMRSEPGLVALSSRISLEFDKTTQASLLMESNMVESHMRVIQEITDHQAFMQTFSSVEPILAEAAAVYLDTDLQGWGIALKGPGILAQALEEGLLAQGDSKNLQGQLWGRLLLTGAHDIAVEQYLASAGLPRPNIHQPRFHRPVPVLHFLRALFAKNFHKVVLGAASLTNDKSC